MTEPITPASMPASIDTPDTEPEPPEAERPPRTMEWFENEVKKLRKESATYRTKLREAEATIEKATAQLSAMWHSEIERIASQNLRDGSDVWQVQSDPAAFIGNNGAIDPEKVTQAAQELIESKPHYQAERKTAPPPTDRPIESLRGGASPGNLQPPQKPQWSDVIPRPPHGRLGPVGD